MSPSAHVVRRDVLEPAMELQAVAAAQHDHIAALVNALRDIVHTNLLAGALARDIAGTGDELARFLHAQVTSADPAKRQLGIRGASRALRPALRILAKPADHRAAQLYAAVRAIDTVSRAISVTELRSDSLRNELGRGPHDLLLGLLEAPAHTVEAAA